MEGSWGAHRVGFGVAVVMGVSRSTSIVPGGQELSKTQQESGGPFLKSDQLELLSHTPLTLPHSVSPPQPPSHLLNPPLLSAVD